LAAEEAGFGNPDARPTFLTLETAQYFMARVAAPFLAQGYFEAITIDRNRLFSQILDNLNKSAVVGFPVGEIAERLKAAWVGETAHVRVYEQAQTCAEAFRKACLAHNLLDFSLQMQLFFEHLWPEPLCRAHLLQTYTHLIADNVEEDTPVAHRLLREWLPQAASACVIFDEGGGHRVFLGADPEEALSLQAVCDATAAFTRVVVSTPPVRSLTEAMERAVSPARAQQAEGAPVVPPEDRSLREALHYASRRYYPEMLDWAAETIAGLVHDEGAPPGEIVVLAPFLTDALRFSLMNRLAHFDVPARSHRPSRALREEPATQCLLTFAMLAHPGWGLRPTRYDVTYALVQAIAGLDLVRAQLLANVLFRLQEGAPVLAPFAQVKSEMQERITYLLGGRYEALRIWLDAYVRAAQGDTRAEISQRDRYRGKGELDHFLGRLFGELLSQPGFGFHDNLDAARVAQNLIESVRKFRWIAGALPGEAPLGKVYVEMVQAGVVAAQYIRGWRTESDDAVLLAPAYTFLMGNRPVDYQFWLNVGGRGWWERLYQPLTHPYVLSRRWERRAPTEAGAGLWTDRDEVAYRQESLRRLTQGLLQRCRKGIFLGLSELGEQGYEQQGPLLTAIQRVLRGVQLGAP
ncbi:MAG: hypothetical protein JXB35_10005, partial [Anaerolineae bacterium]|nr:hypothetical protein [Anaerolineae bacterium]